MRRPTSTKSLFERFMERLRYFLALSLFNVFPLPRQSGFLRSFRFAGNLVDRRWNLLVFPEGRTTDRKSTRLNSSHSQISYAVFCLKKKKKKIQDRLTMRRVLSVSQLL